MEQMKHSSQFLRKRKFLLMLPVLVLPFLVLFFFALVGGKGTSESQTNKSNTGLNVKLPDAHFKKGGEKSKLSIYEEAGRDSAKLRDRIKNDPYYLLKHHDSSDMQHHSLSDMSFDTSKMMEHRLFPGVTERDENETRIMEKLAKLKSVIRQKSESPEPEPGLTYSDLRSSLPKS